MSASKALMKAASGVETGNPWDISGAEWRGQPVNYFAVNPFDSIPRGLFFKPDGLKMYIVGDGEDLVQEFDLSTAWDVTSASFLQSFDVSSQETNPEALFFKPDGTKMYVVGRSNETVFEYDLSTAWDISSASYLQGFQVKFQEASPRGLFFKSDGTEMYICGSSGDEVNQFNLSTAWDVSSASFDQNFDVSGQEANSHSLFFRSDGLKMYIAGTSKSAYEYDLSTAWDISSASFNQSFDVSSVTTSVSPSSVYFKPDGSLMFTLDTLARKVRPLDLSTAWDISSASYAGDPTTFYLDVSTQDGTPRGLFFKPDGLKMFFIGNENDSVYEYDLSTEWDIASASFLQSFDVSSQETAPQGLFFKPDGTKFYIAGTSADLIQEYDLSTAWDISSASFNQSFDPTSQNNAPLGVFFKPDGTKMYVIGTQSDEIHEYNLSTAWDISSSSFNQTLSIELEIVQPACGLFFKPDGLKMYVNDTSENDVSEFDLSTAWDISSASFLQSFSVAAQASSTHGLFFKPDGLKMYISCLATDAIYEYDL